MRALHLGLGSAPCEATLAFYPRMPGNSSLDPTSKWRDRIAFRPERRRQMHASIGLPCQMSTLSELLLRGGGCAAADENAPPSPPPEAAVALPIPPDVKVALLKIDVEGSELDVLGGIEPALWPRLSQLVVETHSAEKRAATAALLAQHYEVVGELPDDELRACGLDRAVVWARSPRRQN